MSADERARGHDPVDDDRFDEDAFAPDAFADDRVAFGDPDRAARSEGRPPGRMRASIERARLRVRSIGSSIRIALVAVLVAGVCLGGAIGYLMHGARATAGPGIVRDSVPTLFSSGRSQPIDPSSQYVTSCSAEPPHSPGNPTQNGRFVASVSLHDDGNVGLVYAVKAYWWVSHDVQVVSSTSRSVPPHVTTLALLRSPASAQELAGYRASDDPYRCSVQVQLTGTFGTTFRG